MAVSPGGCKHSSQVRGVRLRSLPGLRERCYIAVTGTLEFLSLRDYRASFSPLKYLGPAVKNSLWHNERVVLGKSTALLLVGADSGGRPC